MIPRSRPALRRGVRLIHDPIRDRPALLYPEGVLLLNETAGEILTLCDGARSVIDITQELTHRYFDMPPDDILSLLQELDSRHLLADIRVDQGKTRRVSDTRDGESSLDQRKLGGPVRSPAPVGMLAEVTYRCPLHCAYCSNPVQLAGYKDELGTEGWVRAIEQARELGVLQVHFSGGEPLLRRDLVQLVAAANRLGMYTNLVTSGIPLDSERLAALADAGLDHLQLSIQDAERASADAIAGIRAHDRKLAVAAMVRAVGLPLTVNAVLHAANIERTGDIAELAVEMGAERLELAHTQFYGWGLLNRAALLPTPDQVRQAARAVALARERHGDRVEIVHVVADYHGDRPKPCNYGWGTRQFVIAPNGDVLPCLAAAQLPDLDIANVKTEELSSIWYDSRSFNRFRGTHWLPEPCQSCALRDIDYGGCRCQAYQLTGDAAATDPACGLSPQHHLMTALVAEASASKAAVAVPRRMR